MDLELLGVRTLEDARRVIAFLLEERAALRAQVADVEELRQQFEALQAQVAALTARVHQTSQNSSRPPSADPPSAPPRPPQRPTGGKRGAQPGHPQQLRTLVPETEVTTIVDHWPAQCHRCDTPLLPEPVGDPLRHQVTELPPIVPVVTEHRRYRVACPHCAATTLAPLPADVPAGAFGPRLQATVALLSGRYRLSRREVAAICGDVLGVTLCVGSVQQLCAATTTALCAPIATLEAAIRRAAVAHSDETSWKEAGQRRWLWTVVTALATVFTVAASRGSVVIKGLLGEDFAGRLVSDRYSAYSWVPAERRQVCWAHLKRDFQGLVDWGGHARPVGLAALALTERLFAAWHTARDDPAQRAVLVETVAPLQAEFRVLLETEQANRSDKAAGLCRALLKLWPALWTFVTLPGVEPTNNAAERALRPAVLWRKGSFGSQSAEGAQFVARLLTVAATCRQHDRPLLPYLTDVCTAAQVGRPIPGLLPAAP